MWGMKRRGWNVWNEMQMMECGVLHVEDGMWGMKCRGWNVEDGM